MADHHFSSLLACLALTVPFALGLDPSMPNPISAQLEANRLADVSLVASSGLLLHALQSRTSATLWVDSGVLRRAAWFAALTAVSVVTILSMGPVHQPSAGALVVSLGCLWAIPVLASLCIDLMAGFLWLFVLVATMVLTPQGHDRPWWSPIYDASPSEIWVGLCLLALTGAGLVHLTNAAGHRRF